METCIRGCKTVLESDQDLETGICADCWEESDEVEENQEKGEFLTFEDLVLFKHLLKCAHFDDPRPLNGAEKRHYILSSDLTERLAKLSSGIDFEDLSKMKASSKEEIIFSK